MPRFDKHGVIAKLLEIGLLPTFYNGKVEVAKRIIEACALGGAKVVEFTNRGDFAYQVFTELVKWCSRELPEVILGVGTIIEPGTASLYIASGANFIVGPVFNPEVAKICNRHRVAYIPGCSTPSEISKAEEMGVDIVKVFPAKVLGPYFIKAVLGPSSRSKLMPSGGLDVTRNEVSKWIKAGAAVLNIGTKLIPKELTEEDFKKIREKVEKCILWIKETREES